MGALHSNMTNPPTKYALIAIGLSGFAAGIGTHSYLLANRDGLLRSQRESLFDTIASDLSEYRPATENAAKGAAEHLSTSETLKFLIGKTYGVAPEQANDFVTFQVYGEASGALRIRATEATWFRHSDSKEWHRLIATDDCSVLEQRSSPAGSSTTAIKSLAKSP